MDRTTFENVDVQVVSATDLSDLHAALVKKTHILLASRIGRTYHLRFALLGLVRDPGTAVQRLARILGKLPLAAMRQWKDARTREFDFGFSAGRMARATGCFRRPSQPHSST